MEHTLQSRLKNISKTEIGKVTEVVLKTWFPREGESCKDEKHRQIEIIEVQKVENSDLFHKYEETKGNLIKKLEKSDPPFARLEDLIEEYKTNSTLPETTKSYSFQCDVFIIVPAINEYYMFYGAQEEEISFLTGNGTNIVDENKPVSIEPIHAFVTSSESDQYTENNQTRDESKLKKMILGKFALGEIFVTQKIKEFSGPPCKTCQDVGCTIESHNKKGTGFYDCVVLDGKSSLREFLVFNKNQCFPEYVITYQTQ